MDWYCAVWNCDKVNNDMGAQMLYEKLCRGDDELVSESEKLEGFYEEVSAKSYMVKADKGNGFIILSCEFNDAEVVSDLVQGIAKKYELSFYDPQNMYYINFRK